jgi:hypothetical protein
LTAERLQQVADVERDQTEKADQDEKKSDGDDREQARYPGSPKVIPGRFKQIGDPHGLVPMFNPIRV